MHGGSLQTELPTGPKSATMSQLTISTQGPPGLTHGCVRWNEGMTIPRLGRQTPRYQFFLNPYQDARFTRCPKCEVKTRQKKLPLVIHVNDWGMFVLNKTCRFCPGCHLPIVHQDDLEAYLTAFFEQHAPEVVGSDYLVIGTVDRPDWKRGTHTPMGTDEMIDCLHDFKDVLQFEVTPRWIPPK